MEVPIEYGLEVAVQQHDDDDSDAFTEECEFNGYIRTLVVIDLTPSYDRAHLGVVRCTLAHPGCLFVHNDKESEVNAESTEITNS